MPPNVVLNGSVFSSLVSYASYFIYFFSPAALRMAQGFNAAWGESCKCLIIDCVFKLKLVSNLRKKHSKFSIRQRRVHDVTHWLMAWLVLSLPLLHLCLFVTVFWILTASQFSGWQMSHASSSTSSGSTTTFGRSTSLLASRLICPF